MDLRKASRDPWVWGQTVLLLLVVAGAPLVPRYINLGNADFMLNRVDPAWLRGLGAGVLGAGIAILAWGVRSLGRNITPGVEPLAAGELVTTGAYAHVRHPVYAGLVLILAGYTLAWSNWTLALIVAFLSLKYFEAKAAAEERWLMSRFPAYQRYAWQVRRRVL